jgi:hypothetical protein
MAHARVPGTTAVVRKRFSNFGRWLVGASQVARSYSMCDQSCSSTPPVSSASSRRRVNSRPRNQLLPGLQWLVDRSMPPKLI